MSQTNFRKKIEKLLSLADIKINGERPWDILVHNQKLYSRVLAEGSLGLGKSYVEGWWDCQKLDEFFYRILRAGLDTLVKPYKEILDVLKAKLLNLQNRSRAFQVGGCHYDIGNELYSYMLDRRLIYSCGYWKDATTLDGAQEAKLKLVCEKLQLQPGMRVLDIGCGWGGAPKFAAENYQVEVVGITVSKEQSDFAKDFCKGLPVEIRLQDYRDINSTYDRIFSLGMFEHVGYKNYVTFMRVVTRHLKDNGLFLLHTIGGNTSQVTNDPWLERYIFPNSMLPSARQICRAAEGLLVIEDWHNFGPDYDRTLMHWFQNFETHWDILKEKYDECFHRMWKYYLLSCAGSFRARKNQLWQIVFSRKGVVGGYCPVR